MKTKTNDDRRRATNMTQNLPMLKRADDVVLVVCGILLLKLLRS